MPEQEPENEIVQVVIFMVPLIAYLAIAGYTFQLRHPWMTDTERWLCIGKALTFGTVSYDEMRPRETSK